MKQFTLSIDQSIGIARKYIMRNPVPDDLLAALSTLIDFAGCRTPVVKGWVARDEDETLWLHLAKPYRTRVVEAYSTNWIWYSGGHFRQIDSKIDRTMFKDLNCSDEPIEVGLFITPMLKDGKLAKE